MSHTPTPWTLGVTNGSIYTRDTNKQYICQVLREGNPETARQEQIANAEFIVRACNAHEELLSASNALMEAHATGSTTKMMMALLTLENTIKKVEGKE